MKTGLFGAFPPSTPPSAIRSYLDSSSYDELLELNLNDDSFRAIYHIEGKYYLPVVRGSYSQFYEFVADHAIHEEDRESYLKMMRPSSLSNTNMGSAFPGTAEFQFRIRAFDRDWRWVSQVLITGKEYGLAEGIVYCYIFDVQNIKDRENGLTRIVHSVSRCPDPITGLMNKTDFYQTAESTLNSISSRWMMIVIDLEKFKLFNEWYGRKNGDLVLARIGSGLRKEAERAGGLAGYMGNDDFCLLVPDGSINVSDLYNSISNVTVRFGAWAGFLPALGISYTTGAFHIVQLYDRASLACSFAKGDFKERIRYYDQSMIDQTEMEYRLLSDFRTALFNHEITFYLQPQCRASSGKIVGAEALARWIRPGGTMVSPGIFVPILERYGFITELDKYIWEDVFHFVRGWLDKGLPMIPISINVSMVDVFTIDVVSYLSGLMDQYRLPRNTIKIEITESACGEDPEMTKKIIRDFRDAGFLVLMDDFGSGYSSLNMLHELDMDIIKLDSRFLDIDSRTEKKGIHILESIINMTKTMGLPIIVEGVESEEQKEFLMTFGCRYMQGYHFYRPLPAEELERLVRENDIIDSRGLEFKSNEQFRIREFLDASVYSDSMLNEILGPVAIYSWHDEDVDIVRFNNQFYEAVNVPDFHQLLRGIQNIMPPEDAARMKAALERASSDPLNGASEILSFYHTAGGSARFLIHFYYLETDGKDKRYYGSARDVTQISTLQKNMELISKYSSECMIILSNVNNGFKFSVAANGLRESLGLDDHELEEELNSGQFFNRIIPEQRRMLGQQSLDAAQGIDFSSYFAINTASGNRINLFIRTHYVDEPASAIKSLIFLSHVQQEE